MTLDIFYEVTAVLALAAAAGLLAVKLKQPLIVAFIVVGILAGPAGVNLVRHQEALHLLAELGISILLFVVGLRLDLHLIRTMGKVSAATGLGQVAFTSIFGFLIARGPLGLETVPALYVAVALTFSSTIIIVKLLSDKGEIDSLHGKIAVGFLIVQDIVVVIALIGLTAIGAGTDETHPALALLGVVVKGAAFLGVIVLLMRYVLKGLLDYLARSRELLLLFSVAWAVLLAAAGDYLGFSRELGAFLAGISLAGTPYRDAIGSRLTSLRDFLLLFFFISLGSQLEITAFRGQIVPALVLSVFVLVGNPLIVLVIMGRMGYRKRTGFLAGLTVAQISEFSLILAALGLSLGHIASDTLGLITVVGLVTIGLSTYMIIYSYPLYRRLSPLLGIFQRKDPFRESESDVPTGEGEVDVILFGLGNYGGRIAEELQRRGKRVIGVDFDPEVLRAECRLGLCTRFGDLEDPDIFENLPLDRARWVVNTVRLPRLNLRLIERLKELGYRGKVAAAARNDEEAEAFTRAGADRVLQPYREAAEQAAEVLGSFLEEFSEKFPWAAAVSEVVLAPGSPAAGRSIGGLNLRAETGVTILGVIRYGRTTLNPGPDFILFPRDRLILAGEEKKLAEAASRLQAHPGASGEGAEAEPRVGEVTVAEGSDWAGRTLAELALPRSHGVRVLAIRRGEERVDNPGPGETIREGDVLTVFGPREALSGLQSTPGS